MCSLISFQLKTIAVYRTSDQLTVDVRNLDYKFLLIPVVFIGLRLWSFLGDLLNVYVGVQDIPYSLATALILLQVITVHSHQASRPIGIIIYKNCLECQLQNLLTNDTFIGKQL